MADQDGRLSAFITAASKLSALRLLDPQTPLVRAGLLTLRTRRGREDLLGLQPAVPERVQRLLLGHIAPQRDGEHAALVEPARPWASVCLPEDDARRLEALLEAWPSLQGQAAPRLGLILAVGPSGTGKTSLAEAIAARLGRPLLRVEGGLAGGR